ncbi:hypothetical protein AQ490_24765 [Wenjunlia vitaminophila]|uniref:SnoaL-like domain-containing protein n=1 Tax=Wenjunlia vitaminophila TaxID=76728 RepID=A0A0T6LRC7_WENVI|nr:hypothetical protein AQ490_24765 [Wenjunlia vitaminophila]
MDSASSTEPGRVTPREVAARLYAAASRGDTATVGRLLHPEARLDVPGTSPVSGVYHGLSGFLRFTSATNAIVPGGAQTEIIDIMDGRRHAAVYGVSRATRTGRPPLTNPTVHLVTVDDARVTAITIFNADQRAVDDFWS